MDEIFEADKKNVLQIRHFLTSMKHDDRDPGGFYCITQHGLIIGGRMSIYSLVSRFITRWRLAAQIGSKSWKM